MSSFVFDNQASILVFSEGEIKLTLYGEVIISSTYQLIHRIHFQNTVSLNLLNEWLIFVFPNGRQYSSLILISTSFVISSTMLC